MHVLMWALRQIKNPRSKPLKVFQHGVNLKNFITKKPIHRKPLAKTKKMCYNIFWVPVIRLYRSAAYTSVQGYRTCDTVACLFCISIIPHFAGFVNSFFEAIEILICAVIAKSAIWCEQMADFFIYRNGKISWNRERTCGNRL